MSKGLRVVSAKTLHELTHGQYHHHSNEEDDDGGGFLVILQKGPTCGLVAILMAFYNSCSSPMPLLEAVESDLALLLSLAQASGDSERGEVFDPELMVTLVRQFNSHSRWRNGTTRHYYFDAYWRPWKCASELTVDPPRSMALVAYDKGTDHFPITRDGSNSHWCLVPFTSTTDGMVLAFHGLSRLALWTEKSRLFASNQALAVRRGFWDSNGGVVTTSQTGLVANSYPRAREGCAPNKLAGSIVFIVIKEIEGGGVGGRGGEGGGESEFERD